MADTSSLRPVISVFGSSKVRESDEAHRQALELGKALGGAGFTVATGGYSGVMEAVSRGAAEAGAPVIGVVARSLSGKANPWVNNQITVETWDQRLFRLIELGNGYIACPGATGTLVELAVAWEMMAKRQLSRRPLIALGPFWRPVVEWIESSDQKASGYVSLAESVASAIEILQASPLLRRPVIPSV